MRELHDHKVNPCNDAIRVTTVGDPDVAGAHSDYAIAHVPPEGEASKFQQSITFQRGPVCDGVNGITNEVLLAIVVDRLRAFQAGPYTCRENSLALTKLEEAQHWLLSRTRARMARGVEGTHEK